MPEVRLHYRTLGEPSGQPVLLLHGTSGSGAGMLTNAFAGALFGRGQPLDASKYFIILPDALGAGASSKPSDGLRTKFPRYSYEDIVDAQYRLVTEGLGIQHLRLVIGNSMGGMQTWLWGEDYPGFMDVLVPMASQPTPMASRNWMLRRMMIETIRSDPEWNGGNYSKQPQSLRMANAFFGIATSGGTLAYQKLAPTREAADKVVERQAGGKARRRCQRSDLSGPTPPATTIHHPLWSASKPRCWRSIRRTTNAIRRKPESRNARSNASRTAGSTSFRRAKTRAAMAPPATPNSTHANCKSCSRPHPIGRCGPAEPLQC